MTQITPEDIADSLERARDTYEAERRSRFASHEVPENCLWPATWVYHRDSKLGPHWRAGMSVEEVEEHTINIVARRFPECPAYRLPMAALGPMPLNEALHKRRSCRVFADQPIPFSDLAAVLLASCGVTDTEAQWGGIPKRSAPSGGALYPVDTWLLALSVQGLPEGVYHYSPLCHELALVGSLRQDDLATFLPPGLLDTHVGALVVLTNHFARTAKKYVERGYRFALLEAGHVAQNLAMAAVAVELGAVCVGGFWDDPLNDILGINSDLEAAVYAVMLGVPVAFPDGPPDQDMGHS